MRAVGVLDHQLAAVVLVRVGEEQRRRQVGADAVRRAGDLADGVVDVVAERLAALVAIEQRREDAQRQRRGDEQRVALQRAEDQVAELARDRVALGQLQVVLGPRRLMAGGDLAVDPAGGVEAPAGMRRPAPGSGRRGWRISISETEARRQRRGARVARVVAAAVVVDVADVDLVGQVVDVQPQRQLVGQRDRSAIASTMW